MPFMDKQLGAQGTRFRRRVLTFAITGVLLAFFSVPIAIILYGGAAAALGGLIVIGMLIACQLPAFMLLKRFNALPPVDRDKDD